MFKSILRSKKVNHKNGQINNNPTRVNHNNHKIGNYVNVNCIIITYKMQFNLFIVRGVYRGVYVVMCIP